MVRKLANGILCFGPATFVSVAFILSQFGSRGCKYIQIGTDPDDEDFEDLRRFFPRNQVAYAGLYCWRAVNGNQYLYSENFPYSDPHNLARQMGLATTIMGGICWCIYIVASCLRFPPPVWLLISLTLVATCICEGMTFVFFNTDLCEVAECGLGTGAKCGISACVFWFASSLMTCGVFKEAQDRLVERNRLEGSE